MHKLLGECLHTYVCILCMDYYFIRIQNIVHTDTYYVYMHDAVLVCIIIWQLHKPFASTLSRSVPTEEKHTPCICRA